MIIYTFPSNVVNYGLAGEKYKIYKLRYNKIRIKMDEKEKVLQTTVSKLSEDLQITPMYTELYTDVQVSDSYLTIMTGSVPLTITYKLSGKNVLNFFFYMKKLKT